ncbi:hypothetical protein GCM10009611_04710 [Arthrobacter roseus]
MAAGENITVETAHQAATGLDEAAHRGIYASLAQGNQVQAVARYRQAKKAGPIEGVRAVAALERFPQEFQGPRQPGLAATSSVTETPSEPVEVQAAEMEPADEDDAAILDMDTLPSQVRDQLDAAVRDSDVQSAAQILSQQFALSETTADTIARAVVEDRRDH